MAESMTVTHMTVRMTEIIRKMATAKAVRAQGDKTLRETWR